MQLEPMSGFGWKVYFSNYDPVVALPRIAALAACAAKVRFPELGRRFYEMGPGYLRGQLRDYLELCVSRGELQIEDLDLAADQFPELCKAELFPKLVFGVIEDVSEAEIDRVVHGAVHTFMTCYGRKPRVEKARK